MTDQACDKCPFIRCTVPNVPAENSRSRTLPMRRVTWCQWSSRPAYGQPHRQHTHTDIHIQCLEFSFKESILHITYKLTKSNKGPLLPLRKKGNNLKFHNQRQEHSTRAICFSNTTAPAFLPWPMPRRWAATGCTGLHSCAHRPEDASSLPSWKCCQFPAWSVGAQHRWTGGA